MINTILLLTAAAIKYILERFCLSPMPLIRIDVRYNFINLHTLIHLKWGVGEEDSNVNSHDYDGLFILDIFAFW